MVAFRQYPSQWFLRNEGWKCSQCGNRHWGLKYGSDGQLVGYCPVKLKMVLAYIRTTDGWRSCELGDIVLAED